MAYNAIDYSKLDYAKIAAGIAAISGSATPVGTGSTGTGGAGGGTAGGAPTGFPRPLVAFDGYNRLARDILWNYGVCCHINDQPIAQAQMGLDYLRMQVMRVDFFAIDQSGNPTSSIAACQQLQNAQKAAGSIRPAKFIALAQGYVNAPVSFTSYQKTVLLQAVNAGLLYAIEGPNELNNGGANGVGNGTRAPDNVTAPITDLSGPNDYRANWLTWTSAIGQFRKDNAAKFDAQGTYIISACIASGNAGDYSGMNMEALADFWNVHYYAGSGFQPSYPFGNNSGIGYYSNIIGSAQQCYSPSNTRMGVTTESGASTTGAPLYAKSGLSQAKYILNQMMEGVRLNQHLVATYEMFDTAVNNTNREDNWGFFKLNSDGSYTPKLSATAMQRMQDLRALNNNANDVANKTDWANKSAFKYGLNASQCVISGITNGPNGMPGYVFEQKSDGSCNIVVWNEPVIDSTGNNVGGADVIPAANPVTIYLPRARNWRIHDPLGTESLTTGGWTNSATVNVTLYGYPIVVEVQTPANWTAANGDPLDTVGTGSTTFAVQSFTGNYVRNYAAAKPDDLFGTISPPGGHQWTVGNNMIIFANTTTDFSAPNMSVQGSSAVYGPFVTNPVTPNIMAVFIVPILNPNAIFTVNGMGSFGSLQGYEVPPFANHGVQFSECSFTSSPSQIVTAPLIGVPPGAIGLWSVCHRAQLGQDSVSQPTDTSVVIDNFPFVVSTTTSFGWSYGGHIVAGRAAGNIAIPGNNLATPDANNKNTVVSCWFSK